MALDAGAGIAQPTVLPTITHIDARIPWHTVAHNAAHPFRGDPNQHTRDTHSLRLASYDPLIDHC
jgi:hypothetical protein